MVIKSRAYYTKSLKTWVDILSKFFGVGLFAFGNNIQKLVEQPTTFVSGPFS